MDSSVEFARCLDAIEVDVNGRPPACAIIQQGVNADTVPAFKMEVKEPNSNRPSNGRSVGKAVSIVASTEEGRKAFNPPTIEGHGAFI
jgi:hypothetical protein